MIDVEVLVAQVTAALDGFAATPIGDVTAPEVWGVLLSENSTDQWPLCALYRTEQNGFLRAKSHGKYGLFSDASARGHLPSSNDKRGTYFRN
jgi:hypothetical protein